MDLYIYYRVAATDADHLRGRVIAMQDALVRSHGVKAAIKRRPEIHGGMQTWMEIYSAVPPGFDAALEQAVADAELRSLTGGERHVERFVDIV